MILGPGLSPKSILHHLFTIAAVVWLFNITFRKDAARVPCEVVNRPPAVSSQTSFVTCPFLLRRPHDF